MLWSGLCLASGGMLVELPNQISPMTFKSGNQDRIEEGAEPHTHPEPSVDAEDLNRQSRRLRVLDSDVQPHGYTDGCQRCEYFRQGRTGLAKGVRHNEACREHTYEALRAAGAEKVKRADMADSSRAQAPPRKSRDAQTSEPMDVQHNAEDAPTVSLLDHMDSENVGGTITPRGDVDVNDMDELDDTTHFHDEANDDLDVEWKGEDLHDAADEHMVTPLIDVLQTLGVNVVDSVACGVNVIKHRQVLPTTFGQDYNPTFFETYGKGNLVNASQGCRRNLNVHGLEAFYLLTAKPSGEHWDFSNASDRRLARSMVEKEKPTWLIGSPPINFFRAWNQGLNHKKMDPEKVKELKREAVQHLHFVIGLYRLQVEAGRHLLH